MIRLTSAWMALDNVLVLFSYGPVPIHNDLQVVICQCRGNQGFQSLDAI